MLKARELGGMLQAGRTEGSCRQDGRATLQVAGMEPHSRRAGWWRDTAGKDGAMLQAGGMERCCRQGEWDDAAGRGAWSDAAGREDGRQLQAGWRTHTAGGGDGATQQSGVMEG